MPFSYTFSDQELAWIQVFSVLIALCALLLSVLAVYFTARTYWQKRGSFVRGSYTITTSSVATDQKFVTEVFLENLKDRSIIIFGIYLRLSNSYLIEVELFEESPFILKPFEVVKRTYDPVDFYSFNTRRINLNALFDNRYRRNRLVLATSDGKLIVRKPIPTWNPVVDWFKNHLRITAQIHRVTFHGRGYGANILFLVDLFKGDERIQSIPLYPREYTYKWFIDLGGDKETLSSAANVKATFETAIAEGRIKADRAEIIDAQNARDMMREASFESLSDDPIVGKDSSWFFVNVVGRLATLKHGRDVRRKNQETKKRHTQELKDQQKAAKE